MADISTTEGLTARQHKALAALISEPSIRKAAEASGVPERTLYAWLKDPAFDAEYRLMRREAAQQAIALVQKYSGSAAATLVQLMSSSHPAAIRLAAASKVIDLALRTVEIEDLRDELERLKALVHDRLGNEPPEL